tara:strand:- start:1307 stop:1654 length:348 start_codon:yes stop_codon:yes gene_type:complete
MEKRKKIFIYLVVILVIIGILSPLFTLFHDEEEGFFSDHIEDAYKNFSNCRIDLMYKSGFTARDFINEEEGKLFLNQPNKRENWEYEWVKAGLICGEIIVPYEPNFFKDVYINVE